jgi:hypothetical protein
MSFTCPGKALKLGAANANHGIAGPHAPDLLDDATV